MTHETYSNEYIAGVLGKIRSVAIVGASANPVRASFIVVRYLMGKGYKVFPVNPGLAGQELLGRKVYGQLAEIDEPARDRIRERHRQQHHEKNTGGRVRESMTTNHDSPEQ